MSLALADGGLPEHIANMIPLVYVSAAVLQPDGGDSPCDWGADIFRRAARPDRAEP
jgi:hypothetical protein